MEVVREDGRSLRWRLLGRRYGQDLQGDLAPLALRCCRLSRTPVFFKVHVPVGGGTLYSNRYGRESMSSRIFLDISMRLDALPSRYTRQLL